jgi:hypothetical protein
MDDFDLVLRRLLNLINSPSFFIQLQNSFGSAVIDIELFGGILNDKALLFDEEE